MGAVEGGATSCVRRDILRRLEASVYALADEIEQAKAETAAAREEHAAMQAACDEAGWQMLTLPDDTRELMMLFVTGKLAVAAECETANAARS